MGLAKIKLKVRDLTIRIENYKFCPNFMSFCVKLNNQILWQFDKRIVDHLVTPNPHIFKVRVIFNTTNSKGVTLTIYTSPHHPSKYIYVYIAIFRTYIFLQQPLISRGLYIFYILLIFAWIFFLFLNLKARSVYRNASPKGMLLN